MKFIFFVSYLLGVFFAIPVSTVRMQVRPEEYLGCFTIIEENRIFLSSPGDYNLQDISPLHCMRQCGKKYRYATLQEGNICLCADSLPTAGQVDDSDCDKPCPGHETWPTEDQDSLKCGGRLRNSIYSASDRILGLHLVKNARLPVLKPVTISGNLTNGKNVTFTFELGDGSLSSQPADQPQIRHIYDQPGSYIVSMEATNPVTGSITVSEVFDIDDPLGPVELHCPHSVPLGAWVECNGSLIRGTRINNTFSFEDGLYESISLSSRYYSAGPRIPRENQSFYSNSSASPQGAIVSPAYEFRHDGKVTEWEFEGVKTGNVKLQIFRPRCFSGESYCFSNKSCMSTNGTCQPTKKKKCQPYEIFCIFRRRCITNSTETKISCEPQVPYQTDAPRADYELISENRITIEDVGHHIESLSISEQPTVQQGDVLGWTSEGGELAFSVVTPADGASFEFEYGSHPNIGEKLLRTSNPSMHRRHYIMAAHYVHAADFVIRHLYNSTGIKKLTSNITGTLSVAVDIPVGDQITMTHRTIVNTHDAVVFNIPWHSGSNISYIWDFGDGNNLRTQVNSTTHTYATPGTYYVTLIVANSVNRKVLNTVVYVFDFISGLRFSKPIEAKAIGLATEIQWESAEGTNVTYVVDFGDGSPRYEKVTALEASRSGFITHSYAAVGNYTVTLFAFNRVGPNISISSQALVEIPVTEVHFTLPAAHVTQTVYFAVGDLVTVNRVVLNGTNVKCAFDFKDGSPITISTEYSTTHMYNDTGTYKVEINCYNAVNSVKRLLNATVVVQHLEKITGLVLNAPPADFGTDSEVTVLMDYGTTVFCDVSFGDGDTLKIDFSHLGNVLDHRFPAVGSYNISVKCHNRLGYEEYTFMHDVDIAITDVLVASDKRFIRVQQNVSVDVKVREGTRMKFAWDFGDGSVYSVYRAIANGNESVTSTHAFSRAGKFPVNVTIFNSLSTVSAVLPYSLVAEYPVENIALTADSPVRLNPGLVTFQLSLKSNSTAPTDAVCSWNFNDGSGFSGKEYLEISPFKSHELFHTFKQEGIFTISVNISNNVSYAVLSAKVYVQKIIDVIITVGRIEQGQLTEGFGNLKNYFRSNEVVYFNITSQPNDVSYIWNWGDGSPLNVTASSSASHIYYRSGQYKVEVTVNNALAKLPAVKDVTIQQAVGEVAVTSSYPNYKGDPTYFTIDIEDPGTDACMILDYRDYYKGFFGGEHCRPGLLSPQFIFNKINANQTQINVTHVYGTMGSFNVTLTASNIVSTKSSSNVVNITGTPCDIPTVRITGDGSNDPPSEIQKSEKLLLKRHVTYRCPVATNLVFTWSAFEVSFADLHNESKPLELSEDLVRMLELPATDLDLETTDLIIRERKLPFGLIKFNLKLGFIGKERDLSGIFGTHTVWVEVKRSELEAVIRGSVKRSVGYQLPLTLDGSDSKDPDVPGDVTGITFQWMCKRKEEEFPTEDSEPSSDGGCWENGTFVFGGDNRKVVVYTGDFYQKAFYDFRLVISKDTRVDIFDQSVQVLVGQPPTMVIENVFNNLAKRNPFQRLVVESRCIDCKMDDRLGYKWKLSLLDESSDGSAIDESSDDSWKEINDWADKTATGLSSSSLVIESGFLISGRKYRLQLNAWRPGGQPGGYVIEELFMNVAPKGGSCQIPITQGYALETEFVVKCEGWADDDKPLSYLIELQNGDEIIPMAAGLEPEMSAAFPLGKAENNYTIQVNVKVMDAYMLSAESFFTVRVLEPVSIDYDKVMGDMTGSAGEEGGDQKAVQLATAASSVLNAKAGKSSGNDSGAEQERAAFRGKVAGALSSLPVKDFDGVAMKGEALNSLTQATGEVDEDAQNSTVKALDEMGDFLSGSDSARDVENVAKSLGSAIGNVVGASIDSYQKAANGTSAGDPSKSQNNTKNALGVVDKVSGALQKQLAAGDKPKMISSPNLDMSVGRKTLDGIGGDDDEDDEGDGTGGVKLPNPMALFGGANASVDEGATSAIGSTLSAMDKNPFAWDNSSSDLNSKTVGLSLTDGNGKPLDLAGQELEMFVPRNLKINPVKPMELNHFEDGDPPMRVHKFNRTSTDAAVAIEIKTFHSEIKFMVAVRYGKKPTANHFDYGHVFPTLEASKKMKKRPHPFTFVVPHILLNTLLLEGINASSNGSEAELLANITAKQFYLGVKAINKDSLGAVNTSYALRIYLPACKMFDEETNTWTSKGCRVGPKTIANLTHCLCKPGEEEEVEEEIEVEETTTAAPTTKAAAQTQTVKKVVTRKRFRRSVNKVNIASSMFVAPNPIDFNKVFNANLAENPVALAAVCGIFGVYLILAIYARREDLKDVVKAGVTPLEDNEPYDRQHYEITVYTGYGRSAGTTAEVSFILSGDEGESQPRLLKDPKRKTFQRRGVDIFLATFPQGFGELNYLHIWHNNGGRLPSWYVSRVMVHDLNNDKKYLFICEGWLAVEEGDGSVDRLIPVAGHEEMTSFNHLFYSTTQKNLADGHLWFSVFIRPAKSRFTRLQRITCCLTLLYCSMITNAMFYQVGGESDPASTLQIGPLAFSPAQIGIGIMSSLIIIPVNVLIVGIFRSVEAKPSKDELKERRKSRTCWWFQELFFCFFEFSKSNKNDFIEILQTGSKQDDQFLDLTTSKTNLAQNDEITLGEGVESDDINFRISKQERKEEMEKKMKKKKKKKKKLLPYWFLYIAWVICFLTCFTTAFFCVLYGLQFGKEKSAQWISSMLISFFQDVLISQPIKIFGIALIIAIIVKKPAEEEEEEDEDKKKMEDEEWLHDSPGGSSEDKRVKPKSLIRLQPPDKSKLEEARKLRFKEMKMNAIIKEVALYVFFLACLCIVSYSHRDPTSFAFKETMYNTFIEGAYGGKKSFSAIGNRENFYTYAKTTLMNALYTATWYNGNETEPGFTPDKTAYIVGMARLRQVRVENQSCEVAPDFRPYMDQCNSWYGFFAEDQGQYDIGWQPLKNESLYFPPFTFQSWEFNTSDELDTIPFMGYVTTYGGGGYVADLGHSRDNASKIIETLESNNWIDPQTRAVIIEVATYNPIVNLFCVMTMLVEFLPTNGVFLFTDLKIARLFTFGGGFESFLMACEFFIVLFFGVFIYQELKQLYRLRKGYFKEFWNYVEFFMIVLVLTCIGMFFTRTLLVSQAISSLENNPGKFVSFSRVASWNEVFMYMVALVVFTSSIKGIKLLRFNRRITILAQTLRGSAGPLAAFSVVFIVFFLAYSLFAFAVFGNDLPDFYNFVSTCETVMGVLLGSFDFLALTEVAPVLGPLFFFSFMVFGTFILMNMFLTIVLDVFSEVKESIDEQENEYEIVDFMIRRFRKLTGMQPNKISVNDESAEKKNIQEEVQKDLMAMKKKQKMKARRKFKAMDLVAQRFTRLESSLSGFYCEEWAEERLLDHIVERRWGVNPEAAYAVADAELKEEQQMEELRQDMYAAAERYDPDDQEGVINLSFEGDSFGNGSYVPLNSTEA